MDEDQIYETSYNYKRLWEMMEEVVVPEEFRGKGRSVFDEVLTWEKHDCDEELCRTCMAKLAARRMSAGLIAAMQVTFISLSDQMSWDLRDLPIEKRIEAIEHEGGALFAAKDMINQELDEKLGALAVLRKALKNKLEDEKKETKARARRVETQRWIDEVEEK